MDFAFAAPLGLLIGSFLNVVAYRLPRGESLVKPRSRCTSCGEEVRPYDNVPVLSWLFLRGRCRHCDARISARYPAVELVTALVFAAIAVVNGLNAELALSLPFAAMLIAVASIDLEHRIVPNKILLPLAVWGVGAGALVHLHALPEMLIAGAAAFTALLLAALAYPGGMGMGDVKLAGVMGLYLGVSVIPALMAAFLAGSIVGIAIVVRHGADARKKGVPFAPFLALGGLVGLLAGPELIDLYTRHFL
ncbi:MAG: leader peptidase (prepilin peptidase) / N-methyltransferase [Thermoleophilaceae bacterium]|jgi:leader peptidase (prepilin peptidase)/N-methyltransferase|nr:leader peptidase (prepilin peptidase) / N-methyltransferase [Thermoleophilaceae bacterium]